MASKNPVLEVLEEQRKTRKMNVKLSAPVDPQTTKNDASLLPQDQHQSMPQLATETQRSSLNAATIQQNVAKTTVLVADPTQIKDSKPQKILAQYPYQDNRGVAGATSITSSPDRPYPHREYANGKKVLAQYAHQDKKGAVGAVRETSSPDRPYPYREYVKGKRVLAQYGHQDNKWAVKHPVY